MPLQGQGWLLGPPAVLVQRQLLGISSTIEHLLCAEDYANPLKALLSEWCHTHLQMRNQPHQHHFLTASLVPDILPLKIDSLGSQAHCSFQEPSILKKMQ